MPANKTILVVEDNEINRMILGAILEEQGCVLTEAADGAEALSVFEHSSPGFFDLILMDVQMPVMNGYEAAKRIRSSRHPDADSIPIFAMTADAFAEDIELAKKVGINGKNLVATMKQYNEYVKAGKDTEFNKNILPRELIKAPYYAIEVSPAVHHTMGGVSINTSAEVLTADGKVIKGLYAAGEITGGVHGANRIGGNAMTDITVFGKIAGESAAEYSKVTK